MPYSDVNTSKGVLGSLLTCSQGLLPYYERCSLQGGKISHDTGGLKKGTYTDRIAFEETNSFGHL